MTRQPLFDRLVAIASRDLDDRTISPGDAGYLVSVLTEKKTKFDLDYQQIVQLHASGIIDKDEAREALGL